MALRFHPVAILIAASAFASTVRAQEAATVVVPQMACEKPAESAALKSSSPEMKKFERRIDEYKTCINAYAKVNQDKAIEANAQSRAYTEAANKTITDFNDYVTALNEKYGGKK